MSQPGQAGDQGDLGEGKWMSLPLMPPMPLLPPLMLPLKLLPLMPQLLPSLPLVHALSPPSLPSFLLLLAEALPLVRLVWDDSPAGFPELLFSRRRCHFRPRSVAEVCAGQARTVLRKKRHHLERPCPAPTQSKT